MLYLFKFKAFVPYHFKGCTVLCYKCQYPLITFYYPQMLLPKDEAISQFALKRINLITKHALLFYYNEKGNVYDIPTEYSFPQLELQTLNGDIGAN